MDENSVSWNPLLWCPSASWTRFRSTNETESGETCSTTVTGWLAMVRLVETLEGLARVAP